MSSLNSIFISNVKFITNVYIKGMGRKKNSKKEVEFTTQRVDLESLSKIKAINYHLFKSKKISASQWEIIKYAIEYAYSLEADFIDYIEGDKINPKESAFDTIIRISGKPWFPYGNLVKLD